MIVGINRRGVLSLGIKSVDVAVATKSVRGQARTFFGFATREELCFLGHFRGLGLEAQQPSALTRDHKHRHCPGC